MATLYQTSGTILMTVSISFPLSLTPLFKHRNIWKPPPGQGGARSTHGLPSRTLPVSFIPWNRMTQELRETRIPVYSSDSFISSRTPPTGLFESSYLGPRTWLFVRSILQAWRPFQQMHHPCPQRPTRTDVTGFAEGNAIPLEPVGVGRNWGAFTRPAA